jgi:hypothetical protein
MGNSLSRLIYLTNRLTFLAVKRRKAMQFVRRRLQRPKVSYRVDSKGDVWEVSELWEVVVVDQPQESDVVLSAAAVELIRRSYEAQR